MKYAFSIALLLTALLGGTTLRAGTQESWRVNQPLPFMDLGLLAQVSPMWDSMVDLSLIVAESVDKGYLLPFTPFQRELRFKIDKPGFMFQFALPTN